MLCLRQANLVKSTSIHLGTQLSCICPHLKEEKMKKEGMNFNLTKCLKITIKYARTMINAMHIKNIIMQRITDDIVSVLYCIFWITWSFIQNTSNFKVY